MPIQRRNSILNYLGEKSPLSIEELADLTQVSEVTIRRDLIELEQQGLIVRHKGGAALAGVGIEPMFKQRQKENMELKKEIAKYAAEQISEGEVIALDVGTTTVELAKELVHKSNITIFTSSMQAASILSRSHNPVYLIGGKLRRSEMSMLGSIAIETIMKFNFDRFYLGLAGFSQEEGPTDYSIEETEIKRAFIARSKQVIALIDKTKFGISSLVKVCDVEQINEIITNYDESLSGQISCHFEGKMTFV